MVIHDNYNNCLELCVEYITQKPCDQIDDKNWLSILQKKYDCNIIAEKNFDKTLHDGIHMILVGLVPSGGHHAIVVETDSLSEIGYRLTYDPSPKKPAILKALYFIVLEDYT